MSDSTFSLEAEILEALRKMTRAIDIRSRTLLLNYGLTAPQLTVLRAIARQEPVTSAVLSSDVHLGRPTVTGILNRLELRGLIQRTKEGEDRRSVHIRLTDAGRQMLAGAPSVLRDDFQKKLAALKDWERTQILASLQRLADMMDVRALEAAEAFADDFVQPSAAADQFDGAGSPPTLDDDSVP
ncbi:MAG: MarR family transcriptional regulator [Pirellulaceae bacterium]